MPLYSDVEAVRKQAAHYLSPHVSEYACMTMMEMQRFVSHTFSPTPEQVNALAIRMGMTGGAIAIFPPCGCVYPTTGLGIPSPIFGPDLPVVP